MVMPREGPAGAEALVRPVIQREGQYHYFPPLSLLPSAFQHELKLILSQHKPW